MNRQALGLSIKMYPQLRHVIFILMCILIPVHSSYKDDNPNAAWESMKNLVPSSATDESKLRLALLVDDKIDKNKDDQVQLDELVEWIQECQDKYALEDAKRHWAAYEQHLDSWGSLGWQQYIDREYDHLMTIMKQSANPQQVEDIKKSYDHHLKRDSRRWKAADSNQDGRLSLDEFKDFLYPEHSEKMHDVVVEEKFESLDKDKDKRVSAEEFISSLKPSEARSNLDGQQAWLEEEKSKFKSQIDANHDNFLDKWELASWVIKSELKDNSISEAQQLMQAADVNHDHRLSKEEVLGAYHDFVNSHATDFGEALREHKQGSHDEL